MSVCLLLRILPDIYRFRCCIFKTGFTGRKLYVYHIFVNYNNILLEVSVGVLVFIIKSLQLSGPEFKDYRILMMET